MPPNAIHDDPPKAFDKGSEVLERRVDQEARKMLPNPLKRPCREKALLTIEEGQGRAGLRVGTPKSERAGPRGLAECGARGEQIVDFNEASSVA
jgi:hypothetical protein